MYYENMTSYPNIDFQHNRQYRQEHNITGKCIYLNLVNAKNANHWIHSNPFSPPALIPCGLSLDTHTKYFIVQDPMNWYILSITSDEEQFNKLATTWSAPNEKGLTRNVDCWDVLDEIQYDAHYQHRCMSRSVLMKVNDDDQDTHN